MRSPFESSIAHGSFESSSSTSSPTRGLRPGARTEPASEDLRGVEAWVPSWERDADQRQAVATCPVGQGSQIRGLRAVLVAPRPPLQS